MASNGHIIRSKSSKTDKVLQVLLCKERTEFVYKKIEILLCCCQLDLSDSWLPSEGLQIKINDSWLKQNKILHVLLECFIV